MQRPSPVVVSVSDLTAQIRETLESGFRRIIVEGEVVGFKRHSSGHCYFSLKDPEARLQCVMYRSDARRLAFAPSDGMLVQAVGQVSVYAPRGEYQLIARGLRPAGEGALKKAFEALKAKLAEEGLFDASSKRKIPALPSVVGVVTSRDGAAIRDIVNVLQRRFPGVRLVLKATPVQGAGAASAIANAIRSFNLSALDPNGVRADVLIVGRGGGSEEDLWAFNEEIVARAIHASDIPIVSAVGHETDVSIADFVADLRAPTPSAAAELVVPDRKDLERAVRRQTQRLGSLVRHHVSMRRQRIEGLLASSSMNRPVVRLRFLSQRRDEMVVRLQTAVANRLDRVRLQATSLQNQIQSLDPRKPLERGFIIVESEEGVVTRSAQLVTGQEVALRFSDGKRSAEIVD